MDTVSKHNNSIDLDTRKLISCRYKSITKAVNQEFWNSSSETEHSLYVGSYGRGTATKSSDLDVLLSLPQGEYKRYDAYKGNGQSRLLQAVKNAVGRAYSRTNVHADGQVVVVQFSDSMRFELLPAFKQTDWNGRTSFIYPDSNMGGNWKPADPKAEQEAMRVKNSESNGLLFDTCKHIRLIHSSRFSSYELSGIVIDSFVYSTMGAWHWAESGISSSPDGEYERMLYSTFNSRSMNGLFSFSLSAPGSQQTVNVEKSLSCLGKVLKYMAE
ncbi:nucleotidyltransferase domain-containing protein [Adlercreutzia sp. ZJ138]|uniref:SMODS domain-containing nucleotidyltransferase n=1 Tax=Adlercreutzia sp. ZJ138 TaxID=2709405 RepID=UPI0013EB2775|nr:nucleotidyltransferase domain-containing protein [Adlercreutzia sp. ZJ138]